MQLKQSRVFLKELLRSVIMMIVMLSCFFGFAGCAYVSRNPVDQLPDKSATIVPDQMDREAVDSLLGNPHIASRYWGVEVFRDANEQIEIPMAVVIPVAIFKDDIYRYTLVSYDKDQIAKSAASGIHRRPSAFRMTQPIEYENLTLNLHTGDFVFVIQWDDRYETLLASPVRRDAYLKEARFLSQCTAVIGCGNRECSNKLQVDEGPTLPLPCRLSVQNFDINAMTLLWQGKDKEYEKAYPITTFDTVAALNLPPGSHTLKTWGGRWKRGNLGGLISGEQSITFSCRAGEILYVIIDISAKEFSWWGAKGVEWKIDLQNEMPEFFADRHLVIYRGKQWIVNPEPEN